MGAGRDWRSGGGMDLGAGLRFRACGVLLPAGPPCVGASSFFVPPGPWSAIGGRPRRCAPPPGAGSGPGVGLRMATLGRAWGRGAMPGGGGWLVGGGCWLVAGWWLVAVVAGGCLVAAGWWLVGGWWLVVVVSGGWWLVAAGWWLVGLVVGGCGGWWLVAGCWLVAGWWLITGGWHQRGNSLPNNSIYNSHRNLINLLGLRTRTQ